jgi:hypothetical protein
MTKYQWHNPEAAVSKSKVEDPSDAFYNEVVKVIEDLVKDGLLVDNGQKKWSERTRRFETVWEPTELAKQLWGIKPSTIEPKRLN